MTTQRRSTSRTRRAGAALLATIAAAVALTACSDERTELTVGHDGSPEMRTAAAVYAAALARTGIEVRTIDKAQSQSELLDEVASGEVGLFPTYSGDLLSALMPTPTAVTSADVLTEVNRSLPQRVAVGDPALVSNRWQLVVGSDLLEASGVGSLTDCSRLPAGLPVLATDVPPAAVTEAMSTCQLGRVEVGVSELAAADRVRSGQAVRLAPALADAEGSLGAGVRALRSDGAPIARDLVPVFAAGMVEKPQLRALSRVAGNLTTADLAQMVREVRAGASPNEVATAWVATRSS